MQFVVKKIIYIIDSILIRLTLFELIRLIRVAAWSKDIKNIFKVYKKRRCWHSYTKLWEILKKKIRDWNVRDLFIPVDAKESVDKLNWNSKLTIYLK